MVEYILVTLFCMSFVVWATALHIGFQRKHRINKLKPGRNKRK